MPTPFSLERYSSIRDVVRNVLRYKKEGRVLDLGCGIGRHSIFLASKGFTVTAVDKGRELLTAVKEIARLRTVKIKTEQADVATYVPRSTYDVILSTMVLHFLDQEKARASMTIMQQATRPGGINVISVYTDKNPVGTRPYLPSVGYISSYYADAGWNIVYRQTKQTAPMAMNANSKKTVRYWIEEIIAQKSS